MEKSQNSLAEVHSQCTLDKTSCCYSIDLWVDNYLINCTGDSRVALGIYKWLPREVREKAVKQQDLSIRLKSKGPHRLPRRWQGEEGGRPLWGLSALHPRWIWSYKAIPSGIISFLGKEFLRTSQGYLDSSTAPDPTSLLASWGMDASTLTPR